MPLPDHHHGHEDDADDHGDDEDEDSVLIVVPDGNYDHYDLDYMGCNTSTFSQLAFPLSDGHNHFVLIISGKRMIRLTMNSIMAMTMMMKMQ